MLGTAPLASAEIRLPSLGGDSTLSVMTPQQEQLLGEAFMRSLRQQIEIIEQPEINHYIKALGQQLVLQSDDPNGSFEFFVVRDSSINAFAGPAGKIGIHTGLIEKAESEGELAAVLAHEIAHVTQRHLLRRLESQQTQSLQTAATVLATLIAATANSSQAGEAVIATSAGLSLQQQINFTRNNEQEADRIGMQILHSASYSPENMPAFFKKLQQASRYDGDSIPEYLRTHPLSLSRIADAEGRIRHYPPLAKRNSEEFHHIRTLLLVENFTPPAAAIHHYQAGSLHANNQQTLDRQQFGLGVAQLRADDAAQALETLSPLLQRQETPTLLTQVARAEFATGATTSALKRIEEARQLYPHHLGLLQFHASILQQMRSYEPAIQQLQQGISNHPAASSLYQQLATLYTVANHPVEAHLARAHYHYLQGETKLALQQLDYAERAAKQQQSDFILFSTIDERRRHYEEKRSLEQAEERKT